MSSLNVATYKLKIQNGKNKIISFCRKHGHKEVQL